MSSLTNDALTQLFERNCRLGEAEAALLARLPVHDAYLTRGQALGTETGAIFLVLEGWVCGYRMVAEGRRQIVSLHLPGDMPNLRRMMLFADGSQYNALSHARIGSVPVAALRELCHKAPDLSDAVKTLLATEAAIAAEWIANIGARKAFERVAHLLCELAARLDKANGGEQESYTLPLTQADIGDALGLSTVHINRVLHQLRTLDLVELAAGHLVLPDRKRLAKLAVFDPGYLHFQHAFAASPAIA